uniref:Uncharacterized protein n=1 Tax=Nelumbo nucifera TaxID=4432 RepID=A0A822Y573_NELNU|nr:TPA_asm: hypothetical protein HUJ06_030562 [Nelumbo nucifera]
MEEALQNRISIAAPFIFLIVVALQLASIRLEQLKKKGLVSAEEIELRNEIKKLLKEAGSLTNPSTFAQAAKLRRMAASKEKELQKYQSTKNQSKKLSYDTHVKALMIVKALAYLFLVFWFWGAPVATISQQLLQPFGNW